MPTSRSSPPPMPRPPARRLQCYAFDPGAANQLDTAMVNRLTLEVPWEIDPATGEDVLAPGPVGEYLEVVDVDPASGRVYPPVDLNHRHLLAQDGLAPTEGNPQFHQQMVYAVAMTTIRHFERALGRCALWRGHVEQEKEWYRHRFVRRLRIYPHALREANAYYSPQKKALLFGYFPASTSDPGRNLPGGTVFACLSHEIIAHETTHALLDGMQQHFLEATNPDVRALHEALADVVALFQHFTFPDVLRHQIARTRSDLSAENRLAELAVQFGEATGRYGALRNALGTKADPRALEGLSEPHDRGGVLVAAIFDAFLAIYQARTADLLRIATGGRGVLPDGELHPDLVNRLASEAAKIAGHFLRMAIRALDYCPPVDVTFGDYLRALITADYDLVPNDHHGYRIAIIEACRRRGIYPENVRSLGVDSVRWEDPLAGGSGELYRQLIQLLAGGDGDGGNRGNGGIFRQIQPDWGLSSNRESVYDQVNAVAATVHRWLRDQRRTQRGRATLETIGRALGLELGDGAPPTVDRLDGLPSFFIQTVRPARRQGPDGEVLVDLVIQITQGRKAYFDPARQQEADRGGEMPEADFRFTGGCTLLIDLAQDRIRYCVGKGIASEPRLARERAYRTSGDSPSAYFSALAEREPFAFLHRSQRPRGDA